MFPKKSFAFSIKLNLVFPKSSKICIPHQFRNFTNSNLKPISFLDKIPEGDDKLRKVCETCGFINYQNPKIVAGAVVYSPDNRILLIKRAILPQIGKWTLPGGYMELHETTEQAAVREVFVNFLKKRS